MLTLLPAIDIRGGRAVRLTQGRADAETVYDEDPVAVAVRFVAEGAEWLHVVDLDAAFSGAPENRTLIARIVEATGCRVQASGGVRTLEDVRTSLALGASRVVVGTMALADEGFVPAVLDAVGADVVAIGLDADGETLRARGWTEDAGALFPTIERLTEAGVRRLVFTDIARDGMLNGPNLAMLRRVADATTAHVTASGGVAGAADLSELSRVHPRVDEAIVGKALYHGALSVAEALRAARSA